MRNLFIAMFVGALFATSAASQSVRWFAMPAAAPIGQEIVFTLQNQTPGTLYVRGSTPFAVMDAKQSIIFQPRGLPITMPVAPGKYALWVWNQLDLARKQVAPGLYEGVLDYATSPSGKSIRVKVQVQIDNVLLGAWGSMTPGGTVQYSLNSAPAAGLPYQVALSFADHVGIVIPGMRRIDLRPDALFFASLTVPVKPFEKFRGTLDTNGNATATLHLPVYPGLTGTTICAAFVTLRPASPGGIYNHSATAIIKVK